MVEGRSGRRSLEHWALGTGHILSYYAISCGSEGQQCRRVVQLKQGKKQRNATSWKGRQGNEVYRVREHLTEAEIDKLLVALKRNRYGHRDWLIKLASPPRTASSFSSSRTWTKSRRGGTPRAMRKKKLAASRDLPHLRSEGVAQY